MCIYIYIHIYRYGAAPDAQAPSCRVIPSWSNGQGQGAML